jgi:hypothetical protein
MLCDLAIFTFIAAHLAGFMNRPVAAWSRRWLRACQRCVFAGERCSRSPLHEKTSLKVRRLWPRLHAARS